MSQGGNSNSGFSFGGQRYSPGYPGYSQGGMPPGGTSFNQNRATSGVNPYGGMRPWSPPSQPQQPPYMPPEDFGGSMTKPGFQGAFGGRAGGLDPYTPQQPTPPQNMGGQPQTGGDFAVNEGMTKPAYQQPGFDPFQQALGAMRGTGQQPYSSQYQSKPGVGPAQRPPFGGNGAFGGQGTGAPYDPRTPNYQPGAGNQTMLRQYAMQNGQPLNSYMGNQTPMWGNQQQSWEPSRPQTDSLSEMLRMYRGF